MTANSTTDETLSFASACHTRRDNLGFRNHFKAWYIYVLHLATCIGFTVALCTLIDGQNYRTGSSAGGGRCRWELYQADITGIVSTSLVAIRTLADIGSTLLVWRLVTILLAKGQITLKQEVEAQQTIREDNLVENNRNIHNASSYDHARSQVILMAIAIGILDPEYAFNETNTSLRRYVSLSPPIRWMNAPGTYEDGIAPLNPLNHIGNASTFKTQPDQWKPGTIGFWMPKKWGVNDTSRYTSDVYEGKRNVSVYVGSLWDDQKMSDGTFPTVKTSCQASFVELGLVPNVTPYWKPVNGTIDGPKVWRRTDCFMLAEVTMRVGRLLNQRVDINLLGASTGAHIVNASIRSSIPNLEPDWAIGPTLDLMTDVMRQIFQLNATDTYMANNLDGFVRGTLKLAYDATWSALPSVTGDPGHTMRMVPLESAIRADVNRTRVYIWLAMNFTLQIAAALIAIVHYWLAPNMKMTRDPTLTALMMDLKEVKHATQDGLCDAVALRARDRQLGRIRWEESSFGVGVNTKRGWVSCFEAVMYRIRLAVFIDGGFLCVKEHSKNRYAASRTANKQFGFHFRSAGVAMGAHHLLPGFFSNGTTGALGIANEASITSFYGAKPKTAGAWNDPNLEYTHVPERIPEQGWSAFL
ncbi:hypothetical protein CC86DRAFT_407285 [Ophiobolus disseminans]|uniref:Uncharacterized protein n=1 Tax=Ophiobolus disseminans TaxID=1469910 RepID=A0A6A6ZYB4_9PLEO|nr:hypothetical protein CC86DRAFT_407285 [Ophiobolus disseminans]